MAKKRDKISKANSNSKSKIIIALMITGLFMLFALCLATVLTIRYKILSSKEDKMIKKDFDYLVYVPDGWKLRSEDFSHGYNCFPSDCRTLHRAYAIPKKEIDDNKLYYDLFKENLKIFNETEIRENCNLIEVQKFKIEDCDTLLERSNYDLELFLYENDTENIINYFLGIKK